MSIKKPRFTLGFSLLCKTKLFVELVNTSAGINKLLLSGKEWVALGADFHLYVLLCRASFDYVAACTFDSGGLVIRMNCVLHVVTAFSFI